MGKGESAKPKRREVYGVWADTLANCQDYLERVPTRFEHVKGLIEWSLNWWGQGASPLTVFCILTGIDERYTGDYGWDYPVDMPLGYVELDYLGEALREYATNPVDVEAYVLGYLEVEIG